jgi:Flp pilus assembly protein protease CpaA
MHDVLLLFFLLISSMFDLITRKVPNALVMFAGGIGLLISVLPNSDTTFYMAAASFTIGLLLFLPPYQINAMGAADVKVFAVSGLFMSPFEILTAFFYTLMSGGVLALIYFVIAKSKKLEVASWRVLESNLVHGGEKHHKKTNEVTLPYIVAIFFGVLITHLLKNINY